MYVDFVAPRIDLQCAPDASHRYHCVPYAIAPDPAHDPTDPTNCRPCCTTWAMAGGEDGVGPPAGAGAGAGAVVVAAFGGAGAVVVGFGGGAGVTAGVVVVVAAGVVVVVAAGVVVVVAAGGGTTGVVVVFGGGGVVTGLAPAPAPAAARRSGASRR